MTKQEAIDFVNNNVKLGLGSVSADWNIHDNDDVITIHFRIHVLNRDTAKKAIEAGKLPTGDMFYVGTGLKINMGWVNNMDCERTPENNLLLVIQEKWTSLWMHESLETLFVLKDGVATLPFDPHCETTSLKPLSGTFLTDVTACN